MDAVIFDMDGVLIDSEPAHQQSELTALAKVGLTVTVDDLKAYAGTTRATFESGLSERFGAELDWDALFERKDDIFFRLMEQVETFPGLVSLLQGIKDEGMKLAVATSSQARLLTFILQKFDWHSLFDVTVCSQDVIHGKPDPEVFLTTAKRLGVEPRACVVVEDSFHGLRAAKAAGMYAIGITTTFPSERLHDADRVIDAYRELDARDIRALTL